MLLIAIPAYLFAIYWERAFLMALELTGGIGDAILNGAIPVLMVWSGRYVQKRKGETLVGGGRPVLSLIMLFALFVFGVQILTYFLHLSPLEELRALVNQYSDSHG
jgi:tyrosine-specific transport protein